MAKTRSMTKNQNHDHSHEASSSSSSKKRLMTFDKGDVAPWSDLTHHVLSLVMTKLGVVDYFAFSGVCKSWRSYALSNKEQFMASRTPLPISIDYGSNNEDSYLCAMDFEERRFNTLIPHSANKICYGVTCGYLILYGLETRDFLLVNPITRHKLHFPNYEGAYDRELSRCLLVFSPSSWVFVVLQKEISFYIASKRRWYHVSSRDTLPIVDIHFFKGKIYTLHGDCSLGELRLNPNQKRKWTLLETKNYPNLDSLYPLLVSSGESLYLFWHFASGKAMKLNFGEMKWVMQEKTIEEYAFFFSYSWCSPSAAIKPESWADPRTPYRRSKYVLHTNKRRHGRFFNEWMWYFPHDCLSVNHLDE